MQGLGGAVTSAVILALIVTEFPLPDERAKAMSVYTFVAVGGGSIGLVLGGVLTQSIDWHWIFLVNLPIGIAALVLGWRLIEETEGIGLREGVDVLGSVLVTVAMIIGVYAIVTSSEHGLASMHTLAFGGLSLALLTAFGVLQTRLTNPIMPLQILRLPGLLGSSAVRGLLVTGMFGAFFLGALYFEHVLGYSALQTGLAFLPQTLIVGTLSLGITAWLMRRFGTMRVLLPGLASMTCGLLLLAQAGTHASYFPSVFVPLLLTGLGAGMSFMPLLTIAMADVPARDAGLASGIVNVSMQMAAAVGLAVLGVIATHRTKTLLADGHAPVNALTSGYHLAFLVGSGCVALGIVVALLVLRRPAPAPAATAAAEPANP